MRVIKDIRRLIHRFKEDDVMALASQLAYSLILSFFPFIIFLMTLIGFSSLKSEDVLVSLSTVLPYEAYQLIKKTVIEVVDSRKGNLLSLSLIITIWSASSGFAAIIKGLNTAYDEYEHRGFIKLNIIKILFTLGFTAIIIATFILLVLGDILGSYFQCCYNFSIYYRYLWDVLRYIIMASGMIAAFTCLYFYGPCKRLTLKETLPGAFFSTAGWILISLGFSYYINNFSNYSRFYGSIAAIFILMTWLYLTSIILLIGGELNAVLAFDKKTA